MQFESEFTHERIAGILGALILLANLVYWTGVSVRRVYRIRRQFWRYCRIADAVRQYCDRMRPQWLKDYREDQIEGEIQMTLLRQREAKREKRQETETKAIIGVGHRF